MSETIDGATGKAEPKRRGRVENLSRGRPDIHTLSPGWQAHQRKQAAIQAQDNQPPARLNNQTELSSFLSHQSVAFAEIGPMLVDAAKYLGAVASGRKKGEQWRVTTARDLLDRGGVTGATIERAQAAATGAAQSEADLGQLLARLVEARKLADRRAEAVDAAQQTAETGQKPGTPGAD